MTLGCAFADFSGEIAENRGHLGKSHLGLAEIAPGGSTGKHTHFGTETGYEAQILQSKALAPDATLAEFLKLLVDSKTYENVLFVGHNPNINSFLGSLMVPSATQGVACVRLRKGSLARLNLGRGSATLQWLLDPRTVRALYATSTKSSRRKTSRK